MEKTQNSTDGKTSTDSIGVTEMQELELEFDPNFLAMENGLKRRDM